MLPAGAIVMLPSMALAGAGEDAAAAVAVGWDAAAGWLLELAGLLEHAVTAMATAARDMSAGVFTHSETLGTRCGITGVTVLLQDAGHRAHVVTVAVGCPTAV
jgi:hypothetical protein